MADLFPLAYSTLACPGWSIERAAAAATADGYVALELRLLDGAIIPADLGAQERRRIRRVLHDNGLGLAGIGASTHFATPDQAERAANIAQLRRYLQLANELEAPMVRTFGGAFPDVSEVDAVGRVTESLAQLLDDAAALGVTIGLETHDAFSRGTTVAMVLDQLPHPRLGAIWDVLHPLRHGEPLETTWAAIGSRVIHVHVKDGRPNPAAAQPENWALTPLGDGLVPGAEIVALLRKSGYRGYLCAEWEKHWHPSLAEPEVALPQHARTIRAWMVEA